MKYKIGDIVRGQSVSSDGKIRTWKIIAITEDGRMAIGQNTAAKKHYRQPLILDKMEKIQ